MQRDHCRLPGFGTSRRLMYSLATIRPAGPSQSSTRSNRLMTRCGVILSLNSAGTEARSTSRPTISTIVRVSSVIACGPYYHLNPLSTSLA